MCTITLDSQPTDIWKYQNVRAHKYYFKLLYV